MVATLHRRDIHWRVLGRELDPCMVNFSVSACPLYLLPVSLSIGRTDLCA
jgi:hypothetical protein